jgi:two-component system nitrogen regulation sensor histidine kinase NtrY
LTKRPEDETEGEGGGRSWRKREASLLVAAILAALFVLIYETRLPPFTSSQTLSQNVVFFLLINLNIALILLVGFLLGRNIVKLVVERRQRVLGSHLRTRIVLGFVTVAIAPAVLLFIVALGFIRSSVETWFSVQVESALEASMDMADTYYRESMATAVHEARLIAIGVQERGGVGAAEESWLSAREKEMQAASIRIYGSDGNLLGKAVTAGLTGPLAVPPEMLFIENALSGTERTQVVERGGATLLRAVADIRTPEGAVAGVVVVDAIVPRSVARRREEIERSYRQYKQLSLMRRPLINNYILTLVLVSMAVVFGATWLGFAIARSITGPIQRLAEGTRRVAEGHLDERIQLESGSDEIATLLSSFNRMTANLRSTHSALAERRRVLETILGNITGGVVSIDRQARIETVNQAARSMLGIGDEALGMPFREWFSSPRYIAVREILSELDRRAQQGEWDNLPPQRLSIQHEEGPVQVLATGVVLKSEDDDAIGALLFFEDVTELLKVQRMEAWRDVARRIAHEIKNPLTPIQLSAQRLRKRYAADLSGSVLDECTRTIISEVEALKNLVSEFSSFARMPAGPHQPTDLNELVEDSLTLFRAAHRGVQFHFSSDAGIPLLDLDPSGMRRVMMNLLDNAVAALPLSASTEAKPDVPGSASESRASGQVWVAIRLDSEQDHIRMEIADDGSGMTDEVKERLFEPYFSTKAQGTGLGLAIVQTVLADHRAYIRVRDNQPRGSRFVIEFPVRDGGLPNLPAGSV